MSVYQNTPVIDSLNVFFKVSLVKYIWKKLNIFFSSESIVEKYINMKIVTDG